MDLKSSDFEKIPKYILPNLVIASLTSLLIPPHHEHVSGDQAPLPNLAQILDYALIIENYRVKYPKYVQSHGEVHENQSSEAG